MCLFIGRKFCIPGFFPFRTGGFGIPLLIDFSRDLKRRIVPAELLAGQGDFFLTQRCAVRLLFTGFVRGTETDYGAADNQRRLIGNALRLFDRLANGVRVMAVDVADVVEDVADVEVDVVDSASTISSDDLPCTN